MAFMYPLCAPSVTSDTMLLGSKGLPADVTLDEDHLDQADAIHSFTDFFAAFKMGPKTTAEAPLNVLTQEPATALPENSEKIFLVQTGKDLSSKTTTDAPLETPENSQQHPQLQDSNNTSDEIILPLESRSASKETLRDSTKNSGMLDRDFSGTSEPRIRTKNQKTSPLNSSGDWPVLLQEKPTTVKHNPPSLNHSPPAFLKTDAQDDSAYKEHNTPQISASSWSQETALLTSVEKQGSVASPKLLLSQITTALKSIKGFSNDQKQTIQLQLIPKQLGVISVTLHMQNNTAHIHFQGTDHTLHLLQNHQNTLLQDLSNQGWNVTADHMFFGDFGHASGSSSSRDAEQYQKKPPPALDKDSPSVAPLKNPLAWLIQRTQKGIFA